MQPTKDEITERRAEGWWWVVTRRDDTRVVRRLYRKRVVNGVYGNPMHGSASAAFHRGASPPIASGAFAGRA